MLINIIHPSPPLAEYIKYYWQIESFGEAHTEIVCPTGEIQILLHYEMPFKDSGIEGPVKNQPVSALCGQKTTYSQVSTRNKTGAIGIVFYPHTASAFFPFPIHETTDTLTSLSDIYPEWRYTEEAFLNCKTNTERIGLIENFLRAKLRIINGYYYAIAQSCIREIYKTRGRIPVAALLDKHYLTERTLQRIFKDTVGIPPKKVCGFVKLGHALELCKNGSTHTQNCFEAGYYDQADFTKTIKKYTGCTPEELRKMCS